MLEENQFIHPIRRFDRQFTLFNPISTYDWLN